MNGQQAGADFQDRFDIRRPEAAHYDFFGPRLVVLFYQADFMFALSDSFQRYRGFSDRIVIEENSRTGGFGVNVHRAGLGDQRDFNRSFHF